MDEIIFEFPAGVAVEFAGRDATDADVGSFSVTFFLAPFDTDFGGETGNIFVIFKISPKFYLGARFLM